MDTRVRKFKENLHKSWNSREYPHKSYIYKLDFMLITSDADYMVYLHYSERNCFFFKKIHAKKF